MPQPNLALAGPSVSIADVVERVMPMVVNISMTKAASASGPRGRRGQRDPFHHFFGPGQQPTERHGSGMGSGVIVSSDGLILTNNHVVENATDIRVTLYDKRDYEAEIVGRDAKTDMALLRLKGDHGPLSAFTFGDSASLRLGAVVLAVGNPFGLSQTVTQGIVSAKGRANVDIVDIEDFIQTDAAINPGNSGGALVNMRGELIGINTAILSRSGGADGIGFAIPSDMAKRVMDSLLEHGSVRRGRLGVVIQDLNTDLAEAMGLDDPRGVLVADVQSGTAADKAGLKRGDVIVTVEGKAVPNTGKLRTAIALAGAGQQVAIGLIRNGEAIQISAALGGEEKTETAEVAEATPASLSSGVEVQPLTSGNRQRYGIEEHVTTGVVVVQVTPGSAAAEAGLRRGDVILEANRKEVLTAAALRRSIKKSSKRALLLVSREGQTLFVVLKP
jgi:serine protease Do